MSAENHENGELPTGSTIYSVYDLIMDGVDGNIDVIKGVIGDIVYDALTGGAK